MENITIQKQIDRVLMLSSIVTERLLGYKNDKKEFEIWKKENPDRETWEYWKSSDVKPAEIKRAMISG